MEELIAVVDEHNRFLRWEPRSVVHTQRLMHRSVHILVFTPEGKLVLQQRHRDKRVLALHWDASCAGHVDGVDYVQGPEESELDAAYLRAARRELLEELGITVDPQYLSRHAPEAGEHYEHYQLFRAFSSGPFLVQPTEVEAVRLVNRRELSELLSDPRHLATPFLRGIAPVMEARGLWPSE